MLKAISFLLLLSVAPFVQAAANDETHVWNLEKAYWEYVKVNDLEKYRALWHERFLGWPYSSSSLSTAARKAIICMRRVNLCATIFRIFLLT
jgi:hypothetical protein